MLIARINSESFCRGVYKIDGKRQCYSGEMKAGVGRFKISANNEGE
jgi:hypothetical protein